MAEPVGWRPPRGVHRLHAASGQALSAEEEIVTQIFDHFQIFTTNQDSYFSRPNATFPRSPAYIKINTQFEKIRNPFGGGDGRSVRACRSSRGSGEESHPRSSPETSRRRGDSQELVRKVYCCTINGRGFPLAFSPGARRRLVSVRSGFACEPSW